MINNSEIGQDPWQCLFRDAGWKGHVKGFNCVIAYPHIVEALSTNVLYFGLKKLPWAPKCSINGIMVL